MNSKVAEKLPQPGEMLQNVEPYFIQTIIVSKGHI